MPADFPDPADCSQCAPVRNARSRAPIVDLTCIAGLTGCPQVNLPMAVIGAIPVGLSLIGWRGGDVELVGAACAVARDLSLGLVQDRP